MRSNTVVVMGNGPSLASVDFDSLRGKNTIGINGAYKMYPRMDWWPKYYACFDSVSFSLHSHGISDLIDSSPIEKLFLCTPHRIDNERVFYVRFINTWHGESGVPNNLFNFYDCHDSGATSVLLSMYLKFKKIILLGIDSSHYENTTVDGTTHLSGEQMLITKTPESNPNYWFDDYQVEGDVFNRPNPEKPMLWKHIAMVAKKYNIDIVNCSSSSELNCFRKSSLKEEL